jgi:uncharacterized SAM-binding protein YcdF (DUF218 family)
VLYLNKLLPIFVLPLGWVVLLLVVGLVRKRRWPFIAALAVLYISSMPVVGNTLTHRLESRYPAVAINQVENADAIVSLSGIYGPAVPDGFLLNVGEAGERLEAGITLMQKNKAPWLVFTGGRMPWDHQLEVEGAISRRVALARGIADEQILITCEVGNTADEARAVAALMHERGWRKIILVTSACHMPRAARQFRKAGVDLVPFPVDFQTDTKGALTLLDFLPSARALQRTEAVLREWYGILFYGLTSSTS